MFLKKFKFFIPLLGLTALYVAGNAAFFSVFGLSKLFAGATLSVIFMASSLELAKLVTAAYLYRYWPVINRFMKTYLLVGVITLILITSAGIFGFLSNAYQGATIEFEKQSTTLLYKEDRLEQLEEDKVYLKDELSQAVNSLPDNFPTAKRLLREEYNPKVLELNDMILGIKQEIGDLKVGLIETGVDVGPAIYLARSFGTDIDTVVKFFIFILIFVFLSNDYQGDTIEFEKQSTTLLYKEDRLEQLEEDKVYLKDELAQAVNSLPDNFPTAKRKLRE